jgi:hypothetical protein
MFTVFKTSAQVWINGLKMVNDKTVNYVAANPFRSKGVDRIGGFIYRIWDRFKDNKNVTFQEIFDAFNGEFQASKSSLIFNDGEYYTKTEDSGDLLIHIVNDVNHILTNLDRMISDEMKQGGVYFKIWKEPTDKWDDLEQWLLQQDRHGVTIYLHFLNVKTTGPTETVIYEGPQTSVVQTERKNIFNPNTTYPINIETYKHPKLPFIVQNVFRLFKFLTTNITNGSPMVAYKETLDSCAEMCRMLRKLTEVGSSQPTILDAIMRLTKVTRVLLQPLLSPPMNHV